MKKTIKTTIVALGVVALGFSTTAGNIAPPGTTCDQTQIPALSQPGICLFYDDEAPYCDPFFVSSIGEECLALIEGRL